MTSEVQPRGGMAAGSDADGGQRVADVFVVFGITGDLAKVMTFHSLYRLERRGLLELSDRRRGGQRLVGRGSSRPRPRIH